ncbi:MAG TPA: FecR family protein [Terriglobales bacterium]|nr:FecR family protein [Terriglobales bacterium]
MTKQQGKGDLIGAEFPEALMFSLSRLSRFTLTVLLPACLLVLPATADSHVRIVRLSYIEGGVQFARAGADYQKAILNQPIAEGMKLKTSDDGKAEVEFEDGSTLHLVPGSALEFPALSLQDSGAKTSEIAVTRGTAYVNFVGNKNDEFSVRFGQQKVRLGGAAHLRIDLAEDTSAVALTKGTAEIQTPGGAVELKKNQVLTFDSANDQPKLAKGVPEEVWDSWDDQQNEYHTRYAMKSYNNYSPYEYGTTDLAYYGSFTNVPGYGMMWQPFFAGVNWDPFMDGAWAFDPAFGYLWVSSYPWGWTPYHYGSWAFIPQHGWMWRPGGTWSPSYRPAVLNAPSGFMVPRAPTTGRAPVFVSRGTASTFSGSKLVIRNNSAGLGVPRGGDFGNMSKLSHKVETHGVVTRSAPPVMAPEQRMGNPGNARAGTANAGRPGMPNAGRPSAASSGRAPSAPRSSAPSAPAAPHMSPGAGVPAGRPRR